jgi:protein-glutamine gamma-glutamyltransferase
VRFQATHKLVTYLLVLSAFGTLVSTGALPTSSAMVFLGLVAASWWIDAGSRGALLTDRIATPLRIGVGVVFTVTAWTVARKMPDPDLTPVLQLVLLLMGLKLFHRRNNRDDVHIFVLSFLLVLASAAIGGSFLFAAGFSAYVLLATWSLILFHLRREMEENYLVKHSAQAPSQKVGVARILNSRRVVGAPFFAATSLLALGVAVGAIATFTLVPRVGAGFVLGTPRATGNQIGFSDDVSLGHYGVLSAGNQAVALRATVPRIAALPSEAARARAADGLYWRGTVYDSYDGGHWTRSRRAELRTRLDDDGRHVWVREPAPRDALAPVDPDALRAADRQEIHVVSLPVPMVFALDHPLAYELPAPRPGSPGDLRLGPRWSGEVTLRLVPFGTPPIGDTAEVVDVGPTDLRSLAGLHYIAYSTDAGTAAAAGTVAQQGGQARPPGPLTAEARAAYLQLPSSLSPRVRELALRLTASAGTPTDRRDAIAAWLRQTYAYTLRVPRSAPGMDPVESFLFETRAGHCEYFASAMTILLRAAGIPARYVNGYLGGEWNDIGQYVAVRDNRAHSWAEAYLPESGWLRVDATPPMAINTHAGRLRQLFDSLDFFWSRWVVGYDLSRQLDLAHRLGGRVGPGQPRVPDRRLPGWIVVLAALAAMAVAASRIWPYRAPTTGPARTPGPRGGAPVQRLYRRTLARLARAGIPRRRSETPREYASRIASLDAGLSGGDALAELTELYTAARFGERPVDREVLRALARRTAGLGSRSGHRPA